MPTSRPPYSTGQLTTDQRSSNMVRSQARWASKPSAVSREGRGSVGTCAVQPGPRLGPEGLLLGVEGQVHDGGESSTAPAPVPTAPVADGHGDPRRRRPEPAPGAPRACARRSRPPLRRLAISEGTSPTVSNSCPPSCTVNSWRGTPCHAEVPGQLLRLLGVDDLVVVRVEDEEGRVALRDVRGRAGLLQVGAQLLARHVAEQRDEALGDQHGVALVAHGQQVARPRHVDHRLHAARLVAVGADVPPGRGPAVPRSATR